MDDRTPVLNKGGLVRRGALAKLQSSKGYLHLDRITDLIATGHRVFYSDADGEVSELALGASATYLKSNGASSAPTFSVIAPTQLTGTAWRVFYANGTGVVTELALGTAGQVLTSGGASSAPTWETPSTSMVTPRLVSPASACSIGTEIATNSPTLSLAGTWPAANRAIYVPFYVADTPTMVGGWILNGTVASGNLDIGIYKAGTRLVSMGSTAMSGTSALQLFNTADTALTAGWHYMAMACDNVTATIGAWNITNNYARGFGLLMEESAFPLPATMTGVAITTATLAVPTFGLSQLTTI